MNRPLRIAVADDDLAVRECVRLWLTDLGHEVLAVADGRALVELCRTAAPDLAISDVRMPGLDGLAAVDALSGLEVPVVLMSGAWTVEQATAADTLGVLRLQKPLRPLALVAAIEMTRERASRPAVHRDIDDGLFHQFVEAVEDYAIFTLEPDGRVAHWNRGGERVFGYEAGAVSGRPWDRLFTAADQAAGVPAQALATAAATGRAAEERWHTRADGSRFWGLEVLTALRGANGRLLGYGAIVRDRTDLKRQEDAARERAVALGAVDQKRTAFLATLAHELRNPLCPLLNYAEVLRAKPELVDVCEVGEKIHRQVSQIERLVEDLLDVARVCQGKVRLDRRRVDLRAVVAQAVDTVRPRVEARRHDLAVVQPDAPVVVNADPDRLGQVVVNLLTNAVKYTPSGGRITITVEATDSAAGLRVRDTGVGLAPDRFGSLFELFAQDDRSLPQSQGGLGIGLALVKELVELHGGSVSAKSDGPGTGSEFTVRLPLAAALAPSRKRTAGVATSEEQDGPVSSADDGDVADEPGRPEPLLPRQTAVPTTAGA